MSAERSRLERLLEQGHFAVTGEVGPPQGAGAEGIRHHTALLKGVTDGQNLTDNQTAIVRLSSIAAAVHVLAAGGEPIIQMTCRDRNRIAIQSDLLGAYSLGARNLLCLTGDHQSFGNHAAARNVFDLDSVQLVKLARDLGEPGVFQNGEAIAVEHRARFFVGAAENPFAEPFAFRVRRLAKKVAAGARFIQTQAIFDLPRFARWMEMVRDAGLDRETYILGGICPAKSFGALRHMSTVPGMVVPEPLLARMKGVERKKQAEEGVKIAVEAIQELRRTPGVAGVHIMAIMWEEMVPRIVEEAGLLPRPA
ncbi:MAG TPA: 5,10-methylenetetrahydrofolate reductase [Clostridiales bacterium]|nr:5,10-methylenetetrahydrofolate reductase [Clostridiales bacterium]